MYQEVASPITPGHTAVQLTDECLVVPRKALSAKQVAIGDARSCIIKNSAMSPIMPPGTRVACDSRVTDIHDGDIYAIDNGGLLQVRYLFRLPGGGVRIRAQNQAQYPDEELGRDELSRFRVLGRVFHYAFDSLL